MTALRASTLRKLRLMTSDRRIIDSGLVPVVE
jgi:hypothetical protein